MILWFLSTAVVMKIGNQQISITVPTIGKYNEVYIKETIVSASEFSRSWPAPLSVQLCGRGPLHVLHQGGRRPQAQEPSSQWHAEERPQTAVDGPAERWASHPLETQRIVITDSLSCRSFVFTNVHCSIYSFPLFILLITVLLHFHRFNCIHL